jgi:hypothetical protein
LDAAGIGCGAGLIQIDFDALYFATCQPCRGTMAHLVDKDCEQFERIKHLLHVKAMNHNAVEKVETEKDTLLTFAASMQTPHCIRGIMAHSTLCDWSLIVAAGKVDL